tara:strand:+ start:207 stop:2114 length:1908 start_codon:yes stop_codon:yes gene_type:complete
MELEGVEKYLPPSNMAEELSDFIEAAGLLEYDHETIKKIYQRNPRRLFSRLFQTLIPIIIFLIKIGWDKLSGDLKKEKIAQKRAKEFTSLLVELGPAFIKAGQALSTRPDIIPKIALEELAQLQDQLPGFDGKLAIACIEEDLNMKIEDIFLTIDKEPISAASLGQVHKGILKNGHAVAVKVQRPGLREQITLDLYIVRNIAFWLKGNIKIIRSDLVALIDELGKRIFQEMDYLNEANNAELFKNYHAKNKNICVPYVYKEATSRRVITMEWIDGIKLTNIEQVKKIGIDPKKMIDIGVSCSLQQLLEHGFFHADPHPGNILALKDGRLCYLDFGMMSEVSKDSRTGLIKAVVHLVNKNFEKLSKDFVQLGFISKEIDLKPIVPEFEKVFTSALNVGVDNMDFKSVTDDMSGVMYKFPFELPPYYALIIRSLITLEGIALSVDPKFKILGASYPYFASRLIEDPDPELRESLKEMLFDNNTFMWSRLEELIETAGKEIELDMNILIDQIINFIFSNKGGLLLNELEKGIVTKLDKIGWNTLQKINHKLPENIRSNNIENYYIKNKKENILLEMDTIQKISNILKNLPGFKVRILIKKIPRIIKEPITRKMSINIIKQASEKGMVRLVKLAAGVNQ